MIDNEIFAKPLVVFDLETTGLNKSKDFIIQFAAIKIDMNTRKIIAKMNEYVRPTGNYEISIAAYFKHGIKPDFLADKPTLAELAPKIIEFFGDCNVLTYNGTRFDIPFLIIELDRAGYSIDFENRRCYDAFFEEQRRNGNRLGQTFERYFGKSMEDIGLVAHDALSDVKATFGIFEKQWDKENYEPEKMYGADGIIAENEFRGENKPCFTIGKYRQLSIDFVAEIDQEYLKWAISDKCEWTKQTKDFIRKYIK